MRHRASTVWLALGAALLALAGALPDVASVSTCLALAFLLRGFRGLPTRAGLPRLALLLYLALLAAYRGTIPVAAPVYLVLVAPLALFLLAPFALERALAGIASGWTQTLVFPAALVAAELARSRLPEGPATWYALGYTQYGNLPLMQLAALTGIWGLSFLVGWLASSLEWAWERGFAWPVVRPLVVAFAGTLGAVALWGALRLAAPSAPTLRTAVVSFPRDVFSYGEMFRVADGRLPVDAAVAARLDRLHAWFFDGTEREARAGARLVAWPEMNFLVLEKDEPDALERAKRLAAKERIYIAMGMGTLLATGPRRFQNKTVLVDPSGAVDYTYLKSHPVTGWEQAVMQPGSGRLPVASTSLGRVSSAICFDADDPELVRQAGRAGADLLIVPVNDWAAVKRRHLEMAAFRAIENGTPLLRPASFGVSGAFDAFGRVLGASDHAEGATSLVALMPVGSVPTLYPRVGDLFGWLCVVGTAAACALALRRAARERRAAATGVGGRAPVRGAATPSS